MSGEGEGGGGVDWDGHSVAVRRVCVGQGQIVHIRLVWRGEGGGGGGFVSYQNILRCGRQRQPGAGGVDLSPHLGAETERDVEGRRERRESSRTDLGLWWL